MTAGACVAKADALRPNAVSEAEKVAWVLELEEQLKHEFYPRYQREEEEAPPCAGEEGTGRDTVLSGSGPFEGMYVRYLCAQIDLASQELELYQVDEPLYRAAMDEFRKDWNRTHIHL